VAMYGQRESALISRKAFRGSKYEILRDYRFNLCFESVAFPGYYAEKALEA